MKPDNLDERVEMLERQLVVLREELRREIKQAAHELRGDSPSSSPTGKMGQSISQIIFLPSLLGEFCG